MLNEMGNTNEILKGGRAESEGGETKYRKRAIIWKGLEEWQRQRVGSDRVSERETERVS